MKFITLTLHSNNKPVHINIESIHAVYPLSINEEYDLLADTDDNQGCSIEYGNHEFVDVCETQDDVVSTIDDMCGEDE